MTAVIEIVGELISGGYLDSRALVDGEVEIRDHGSRHSAYAISVSPGLSCFVKVAGDPTKQQALAREDFVYRQYLAVSSRLTPAIAHRLGFVTDPGLLVLELIEGARQFDSHHWRLGRCSKQLAVEAGRALAALHTVPTGDDDTSAMPFGLVLDHPPSEAMAQSSLGLIRFLSMLESRAAVSADISALRDGWQSTSFIHGDLKAPNLLVQRGKERWNLRIVDWELAGIGDPAWDVGSIVAAYLDLWVRALPTRDIKDVTGALVAVRFPLARTHAALAAFWSTYVGIAGDTSDEFLERAMRYAGVRVLQSAAEEMQGAPEPSRRTVLSVQLAANVLSRPLDAASGLLRIR